MTLNVSLRVPDGIVLASDSLATLITQINQKMNVSAKCDRKKFGDLAGLRGKSVRVTGKIEDYRGKPEIKLTSLDQLAIPDR